jgi:hypothetical protein
MACLAGVSEIEVEDRYCAAPLPRSLTHLDAPFERGPDFLSASWFSCLCKHLPHLHSLVVRGKDGFKGFNFTLSALTSVAGPSDIDGHGNRASTIAILRATTLSLNWLRWIFVIFRA